MSITFLLLLIIVIVVATRVVSRGGGQTITADRARDLIGKPGVVLLDVRSEAEYRTGHIKGATLLPLPQLALKAAEVIGDKQQTIIVYCQSGGRSRTAASVLKRKGYDKTFDLGGIVSWPYDIEQ